MNTAEYIQHIDLHLNHIADRLVVILQHPWKAPYYLTFFTCRSSILEVRGWLQALEPYVQDERIWTNERLRLLEIVKDHVTTLEENIELGQLMASEHEQALAKWMELLKDKGTIPYSVAHLSYLQNESSWFLIQREIQLELAGIRQYLESIRQELRIIWK